MRLYTQHDSRVTCLAVHPGGALLASGQAGAVRIWSLATLQTVSILGSRGRGGPGSAAPSALSFAPSGDTLLSLVPPPPPPPPPPPHAPPPHAPPPHAPQAPEGIPEGYSPSSSSDAPPLLPQPSILAVWAWASGRGLHGGVAHVAEPLAQARAHTLPTLCACFLPTAAADDGTGDAMGPPALLPPHQDRGRGRPSSAGPVRLASAGVCHIRYWRLEGPRLPGQQTLTLEGEPNASHAAGWAGGEAGATHLCCAASASGVFFGCSDGALLQLSAASGALLRRVHAHSGPVTCLHSLAPLDAAPCAQGHPAVASGGSDGRVRLWTAACVATCEWRLHRPLEALQDTNGRPLDDAVPSSGSGSSSRSSSSTSSGSSGSGSSSRHPGAGLGSSDSQRDRFAIHGLCWAGPRGVVVSVGRACVCVDPVPRAADYYPHPPQGHAQSHPEIHPLGSQQVQEQGQQQQGHQQQGHAASLVCLALPIRSRRESLLCPLVRAVQLPDAESRSSGSGGGSGSGSGSGGGGSRTAPLARGGAPLARGDAPLAWAHASADGWGSDDGGDAPPMGDGWGVDDDDDGGGGRNGGGGGSGQGGDSSSTEASGGWRPLMHGDGVGVGGGAALAALVPVFHGAGPSSFGPPAASGPPPLNLTVSVGGWR